MENVLRFFCHAGESEKSELGLLAFRGDDKKQSGKFSDNFFSYWSEREERATVMLEIYFS